MTIEWLMCPSYPPILGGFRVFFGVGSSLVSGFRRDLTLGGIVEGCCDLRSLGSGLHGGIVEGRSWPSDHFLCPGVLVHGSFIAHLPRFSSFVRVPSFEFQGLWFKLRSLLVVRRSSSLWFYSFMAYSIAKFFLFFLFVIGFGGFEADHTSRPAISVASRNPCVNRLFVFFSSLGGLGCYDVSF
ncbi:hypothetical protein BVRB_8g189470 [Beta vulgaris subsp. vulgaris]|nr:hypothetical protein BVRB_8g189470 [Beta vulgaris subsp. vulgaris]